MLRRAQTAAMRKLHRSAAWHDQRQLRAVSDDALEDLMRRCCRAENVGYKPNLLVFCAAANVGFAEVGMKVAVLAGIYTRTLEAEPNAFSMYGTFPMQGFQMGVFYGRRHFFCQARRI